MAKQGAIQQKDVQEQTTEVQATGNPRLDRMNEIAARNVEAMAEENGLNVEDFATPATPPADDATPPEEPPPQEEDETPPAAASAEEAGEGAGEASEADDQIRLATDDLSKTHVAVKVDGEERLMPIADVIKGFQKDSAASKRLEEASRRLKEVEEREQALAEKETAKGEAPAAETESSDESLPDATDVMKRYHAAVYDGDEEEALRLMQELLTVGRPQQTTQSVDVAAITETVKSQLSMESALQQFQADYPDIVRDPYLSLVADGFLQDIAKEETDISAAMKKAGEKTRDWAKQVAGVSEQEEPPATTKPAEASAEKKARKAEIDNIPATAARAEDTTTHDAPQSASDVIAEMRRARGLG